MRSPTATLKQLVTAGKYGATHEASGAGSPRLLSVSQVRLPYTVGSDRFRVEIGMLWADSRSSLVLGSYSLPRLRSRRSRAIKGNVKTTEAASRRPPTVHF